jgi:hypothetical protein
MSCVQRGDGLLVQVVGWLVEHKPRPSEAGQVSRVDNLCGQGAENVKRSGLWSSLFGKLKPPFWAPNVGQSKQSVAIHEPLASTR